MFETVWIELPIVYPTFFTLFLYWFVGMVWVCWRAFVVGITNDGPKLKWTESSYWYLCAITTVLVLAWPFMLFQGFSGLFDD